MNSDSATASLKPFSPLHGSLPFEGASSSASLLPISDQHCFLCAGTMVLQRRQSHASWAVAACSAGLGIVLLLRSSAVGLADAVFGAMLWAGLAFCLALALSVVGALLLLLYIPNAVFSAHAEQCISISIETVTVAQQDTVQSLVGIHALLHHHALPSTALHCTKTQTQTISIMCVGICPLLTEFVHNRQTFCTPLQGAHAEPVQTLQAAGARQQRKQRWHGHVLCI